MIKKIFLIILLTLFSTKLIAAGTDSTSKVKSDYDKAVKHIKVAKKYEKKGKLEKAKKRYEKALPLLIKSNKKKPKPQSLEAFQS